MFDGILDFDSTPSATETVSVPCPVCHKEFSHEAWVVVNAARDPLLAMRVREDTLFEYRCPRCGYSDHLVHECLYLDSESRSCIHLVVSPQMAAMAEITFDGYEMDDGRGGVDGSRRRIVFNRNDLREKARAFSAGIDDKPLELAKLEVVNSLKSRMPAYWYELPEVRFSYLHGKLLGIDIMQGSLRKDIVAPRDIYDSYERALAQSSLAQSDSYYVDIGWARKAIEVLETESVL